MKKLFVKLLMLLFVLGMSTTAWAGSDVLELAQQAKDAGQLTPEQLAALTEMPYRATLTGYTSSTGGGHVYATTSQDDPTGTPYVEGVSNVATNGFPISMPGMDEMKVYIYAWAKPDAGYYFAGWSGSDGGTDLVSDPITNPETQEQEMPDKKLYVKRYDVATEQYDTANYVIYGTFDKIRIVDYTITGDNTNEVDELGNRTCSQTVVFTIFGTDIDAEDFEAPVIIDAETKGGGTWTIGDTVMTGGSISIPVNFSVNSEALAEYSTKLRLVTKAGVAMNVPLHARTAASDEIEAIRYNKNKEFLGQGTLAEMIAAAEPTDVIKLNKNYNDQVKATKSFILDLNGYNITHNYSDIVADYSTTEGQTNLTRIAQAAILVNDADAVVTLAYSPYGGKIIAGPYNDAIDVLAGKLVLNGGTLVGFFGIGSMGEVVQNGATIVGGSGCAVASMGGMFTMTDGKIYGELGTMGETSELIINGGSIDATSQTIEGVTLPSNYPGVQVGGGTAWIKKGTIKGGSYGVQNVGGSITIEKLAVITGGTYALDFNSGLTTINCGKFEDPTTMCNLSTIESKIVDGNAALVSCYLKTNSPGASNYWGIPVWRNTTGAEFREGYNFFVGPSDAAKAAGVSVCHIGGTSYSSLEDALAYANNTSDSIAIIMDNDYTLPAGYYTLPGHATLIIPMEEAQGSGYPIVNKVAGKYGDYVRPYKYRKLTLANGVNFDVHGVLEVGGSQFAGEARFTGSTIGAYGQLQMNKGSHMTLQDGSVLRAWGYVTGDIDNQDAQHNVPMGEIDARRGSMVNEQFQMGDWGSDILSAAMGLLTHAEATFPISDYYIQNIEVPVKYHPGAKLSAATSVYADASAGTLQLRALMSADDIKIVGVNGEDNAMFLLDSYADAENTWVRKWYDASKDQQVYEINSGAHIGQLIIPLISSPLFQNAEQLLQNMSGIMGFMGSTMVENDIHFPAELTMNSGQYFLPITTNFKLHLLSGEMSFTQTTELLPGSEVEVDKEATVYIEKLGAEDVREGSLYVYDIADWDKTSYLVQYSPVFTTSDGVPTTRDVDNLSSASINVHGTFDARDGHVFTTAGGGNIFSSVEDAGTFKFPYGAIPADTTDVITQYGGSDATCYLAYLRNSDEYVAAMRELHSMTEEEAEEAYRYEKTAGTEDGKAYCYSNFDGNGGRWTMLEQRGCFTVDAANPTNEIYYIKPQEYVAVVVDAEWDADKEEFTSLSGNSDHTFSDAAGAGRLFILMDEYNATSCQWWEVEQKDNYYHCIHPDNDTYYYWDEDRIVTNENQQKVNIPGWAEVKFTITWKDYDGTVLTTYEVPYGTQAEWLTTNPTREKNLDYTYDFTGWSPALGKVTSDVTYTATYEAKQIKYTIVFEQDGGMEIERHLLARNEMPVCENEPTRTGYILQWEPALAAVTHDTTYVATWLPEPPTEFMIRFVDYDGKTELQSGNVAVDTMPTPPTNPSGKPATAEYTYVFDHWSPAVTKVTQAMTYVAVYREVAKTYTVNFYNEAGTEVLKTEELVYGATPAPPANMTKTDPEEGYTYTYVWMNKDSLALNPAKKITVETVTKNANYIPVFTGEKKKYTVTVMSNPSGACAISGAGIYEHGTNVTITVTPNEDFINPSWNDKAAVGDLEEGKYTRTLTGLAGNANLVINFTYDDPNAITITWKSEDGSDTLATVGQKTNTATIYTGPTPTKDGDEKYSYTFDGWVTETNYPTSGAFYKNNMTPKATEDETYYAHFKQEIKKYTIYWKNEAGTANIEMDIDQPYGAEVAYNSATPTKSATVGATYVFDGWSTSVGGDVVSLPATVTGEATYYAHFAAVARTYTVTWLNDEGGMIDQTTVEYNAEPEHANPTKEGYNFDRWTPALEPVTGDATYQAVFVEAPAPVSDLLIDINESEDLDHAVVERTNLVITSNGVDASGQLLGAENLSITGEAIFRLEQDFDAEAWYAVAVPWTVALSGIRDNDGNAFASGNVYVIEFDANVYASADRDLGRTDYWKFLDETGNDMQPGKLYMIWFKYAQTAVQFYKKDGASLWTTSTSVAPASGSEANQENWNAIANPALYHANMSTGAADGDVLKYNGNDAYVVASSTNMVVGQPIFAQVSSSSTVVATPVGGGSSPAPYHRAPQTATETNNRFVVELTHNGKLADRLIVQTAEEKANEYVIGKDLSKMSVSTKVAQMWMERYNTKLCKNTVEMNGEAVNYPLAISAPVAGEYIISNANVNANAGYALYLTQNGVVIANLSEGDYTLYLNGGTTHEYGLRISARAPQTATGMDEAVVNAQGDIKKVLIDNKVFIIRGNHVYSVDGQLVK